MAEKTDAEIRTLVEYFRDAARREMDGARGPDLQDAADKFIKYDTWLKLDAQEQRHAAKVAKKENVRQRRNGEGPYDSGW